MNAADIKIMNGKKPDFTEFGTEVGHAMSGASPADSAIPSNPENVEQWSDPEWQQFLGLEDGFDAADWSCRKDVYAEFIDSLGPGLDAFAVQHATEIEQAKQYWEDVLERAAQLGYKTGNAKGVN